MTPHEEKQLLLRVVTRLAATLLPEGGFKTFGAVLVLGPNRKVVLVRPKFVKKGATRQELDTYWAKELKRFALSKHGQTVCWCCDAVLIQEAGSAIPAVLVHIEHPKAYSEDMLYPYSIYDSQASLKAPTIDAAAYHVFTDT